MPSLDVDDFMAEHAGQFIGALRPFDQTREDIDRSTGNGEGVELVFLDDEKTVIERQWPSGCKNAPADAVDVAFDLRVIAELELLFGLAAKLAADSGFFIFAGRTYGRKRRGDDRATAAKAEKNQQRPSTMKSPWAKHGGAASHW